MSNDKYKEAMKRSNLTNEDIKDVETFQREFVSLIEKHPQIRLDLLISTLMVEVLMMCDFVGLPRERVFQAVTAMVPNMAKEIKIETMDLDVNVFPGIKTSKLVH